MSKTKVFLLSIIFTVTALAVWHFDLPYPNLLNWDMYEHQTLINEIRDGHFAFLTSQISDTFTVNSYPPFFHLILAGLQIITHLAPLPFWWIAEKVFFFLTVFASLILGWVVTKNKWAAFFSGMFGAFVFESSMAYTSLFLMPQTLCAAVFVFALIWLIKRYQQERPLFDFWQILLMLVIFFLHYIVGAVAVLGLLGIWGVLERRKRTKKVEKATLTVIFLLFLLIVFIIFFNSHLTFDPFQTSESIRFNLNLAQKIELMRSWYGFSFPILLAFGVWGIMKRGKRGLPRDSAEGGILRGEKAILIVSLFLLSLVLTPFPYMVKFYVLARYLLHVVFAIGLSWAISSLGSKYLRLAVAAFFCAIFTIIYINNQQSFKSILHYNGLTTHTTSYDQLAAKFLQENYGGKEGVLLVSEPATQGILEALSGVNTQGGVYTNEETRRIVDSVYPTQDTLFIRNALYQVKDRLAREQGLSRSGNRLSQSKEGLSRKEGGEVLLALSGRFFAWQERSTKDKMDTSFNIWQPQDLIYQDKEYINWLKMQEGFSLVFENEGVAIFKLER